MPPPNLPKVNKNLYNEGSSKGANTGGRVQYPETIVCFVCNRAKPQSAYSTRQLTKWKGTIYQPYAPSGRNKSDHRTTCKTCTPDQTTELTCIVCGETNGLQYFAKTQRKNPDNARCKTCINKQADTAPDLEAPDSDDYASSDDEEDEVDFDTGVREINPNTVIRGSDYAKSTVTNDLTSANLRHLEQSTGSSAPQDDGGWVTKARGPQKPQMVSETMSSMTYDSRFKNGDPANRAPLRSIPPKQAGPELRKNGWAKVDKIRRAPQAKNLGDLKSDDEYDDRTTTSGASEWTDRKKEIKTDFDDDPWARVYK